MPGGVDAGGTVSLRYRSVEACFGSILSAWIYAAVPITLPALFLDPPLRDILIALAVAAAALASVRSLQIALVVTAESIRVTNCLRTTMLRWEEVQEIGNAAQFRWPTGRAFEGVTFVATGERTILATATLAGGARREAFLDSLESYATLRRRLEPVPAC
jgi:hypothetical protein